MSKVTFYRREDMARERVSDRLERRLITGERMMLAHVYLKKGCIVPKHHHENEQITYVLEGALRFRRASRGRGSSWRRSISPRSPRRISRSIS